VDLSRVSLLVELWRLGPCQVAHASLDELVQSLTKASDLFSLVQWFLVVGGM
jgi:hypothetical protein